MRRFDIDFELGASSGVTGRCPDFSTRSKKAVRELTRCFHEQLRKAQIVAMARPPGLTSTRRDARLAAVTEGLAWERTAERFCDPSWPLDWPNGRGRIRLDAHEFVPCDRSE